MMVMNLQVIYRKQDWIGWVDKLACTSLFSKNSWNAHIYPWHKYYSHTYNKIKFHPGKLKIHTPLHFPVATSVVTSA
jgi:hypothetical protein